jgi:hypothetical protein
MKKRLLYTVDEPVGAGAIKSVLPTGKALDELLTFIAERKQQNAAAINKVRAQLPVAVVQ